jgi:predicted DCC family thiol-disulfide oxidoreductase YuxK
MKTLKNNTLIYDQDCPMCKMYTKAFIKTGMLDKNGRKSFCDVNEKDKQLIDIIRASNEIALIDSKNNKVFYGIDSLLKVIGYSFPLVEKIGHLSAIKFFLKKLYSFISFNRKVIMPNTSTIKSQACVPSFSFKWRMIYIIFSIMISTITLYKFSTILLDFPKSSISRELMITLGQILFQSIFLFRLDSKYLINYIGHLMTISLLGSISLLPLILLCQYFSINQTIILGWFFMVVSVMFMEHYRRIKILQLSTYLSFTWVLYRLIVLSIILNLQ